MLRRVICFLFCFCLTGICFAQDSLAYYFSKAKEAQASKDTIAFYGMMKNARRIHPYHPTVLFYSAQASAMISRDDETYQHLRNLVRINVNADLNHIAFSRIATTDRFNGLLAFRDTLRKPVLNSTEAFVIRDRQLHIESIAVGETDDVFYLGSIHKRKIIRSDTKGNITDFTAGGQDGLTSVFGIKVDRKSNTLWACSSPVPEGEGFDSTLASGVFRYDLKSKKLLQRFTPVKPADKGHIFGDLTLDPKGNAYVSDSKNNIIYVADTKSGKLVEFFTSGEFWNLQGIAFNDDASVLFIADYVKGLYCLKIKDRSLTKLPDNLDLSLKSVDGLTFYRNSLIAIQNSITPMRVTRYFLDKDQKSIVKADVIDSAHPSFNEPTIGTVSGGYFYYVANSLWSGYTKEGQLKPLDQLQDVVILKSKLKL